MKRFVIKTGLVFASGCLGGLLNSFAVWFLGQKGVPALLEVRIAPQWSASWLYPRLVWGGIWGALFLLPVLRKSVFGRGLLFSVGPTLVQLFYVFPLVAGKGMLGLALGDFTPLFVFFYNLVWGITAAAWLTMADE
jgi:hypothetical protein